MHAGCFGRIGKRSPPLLKGGGWDQDRPEGALEPTAQRLKSAIQMGKSHRAAGVDGHLQNPSKCCQMLSVILRKMYLPAALSIGSDFWRHALSACSDNAAMLAFGPVLRFHTGVTVIGTIASTLGPDDLAAISSVRICT